MRKLIYHVAVTLDNFIAHPDGTTDGFLPSGTYIQDFLDSIKTYGAVLMGRKTYGYGFQYGLQKGQPAYESINPELTNYVFSDTMEFEQTNRVQLVRSDFAGKLLDAQLIDELIIKLNPIVFGKEIRLFGTGKTEINLTLTDCKPYKNGLVRLSYRMDNPY